MHPPAHATSMLLPWRCTVPLLLAHVLRTYREGLCGWLNSRAHATVCVLKRKLDKYYSCLPAHYKACSPLLSVTANHLLSSQACSPLCYASCLRKSDQNATATCTFLLHCACRRAAPGHLLHWQGWPPRHVMEALVRIRTWLCNCCSSCHLLGL